MKLELGVVRLAWGFLNGRLYFLWRFSRMSVGALMSHVGVHSFGMVMREVFSWSSFFFLIVVV